MNLHTILYDTTLKGIKRRQAVVEAIMADGDIMTEIEELMPQIGEQRQATILEAIEEISNKGLCSLDRSYLDLAIRYIDSPNNSCRREASRIVGNLCANYPDHLTDAIPLLLANTKDAGTVVRWSAAYALSRIILIPNHANSDLYEELIALESKETESGVKSQYTKALKKASKLR